MMRLPMRKIKKILRLKAAGLSQREIAASISTGRSTVRDYLRRTKKAGLSWPLPDQLDDVELERRLFASPVRLLIRVHAHRLVLPFLKPNYSGQRHLQLMRRQALQRTRSAH